eukprot:117684-Prorocentrum_minimum.AAC.1
MSTPTFWSKLATLRLASTLLAYSSAVPPPGTMPSSTAARVAFSASVTRSFFSFTSTSDAPPETKIREQEGKYRSSVGERVS